MHVEQLRGEDREDFDEWLESPFEKPKRKKTPQEEFELAQTRYELGIGPPPQPLNVVPEGEVIRFGSAR